MPVAKTVLIANAVPPVATEYHCRLLPVATKLATVEPEAKVYELAVGAATLPASLTTQASVAP